MAINWDDVDQALRQWLMMASGLPDEQVYFLNDTGPRGTGTFITLNSSLALTQMGQRDEERTTDADGNLTRVAQRKFTASVNTWGKGAKTLLGVVLDALERYDVQGVLDSVNVAYLRRGSVQDLTALLETEYEERAHADVFFALADGTTEQVGTIETVEITGQLFGSVDEMTVTINVGGD